MAPLPAQAKARIGVASHRALANGVPDMVSNAILIGVAQWVEQQVVRLTVMGSNPI